jgi:serine/threonine-protein kinase
MVIGTVHYFSPEQAQGKPATPASDIYALGVILYEMVTGRLPFDADNPIAIAMQHLHDEPTPPWEINRELPARAAAIVMRAMDKEPERRYRDAGEFAAALSTYVPAEGSAGTTAFLPLMEAAPEPTRVQPPPAVPPARRVVARETRVARPQTRVVASTPVEPPNPWRRTGLIAGVLLLLALIAAAAFFVTSSAFGGGGSATATPTATPTRTPTVTPTPRPHHKPTETPVPATVPVVFPTFTPVPQPPTATATSPPPPKPTNTPKPVAPTDTPVPVQPTPTVQALTPTVELISPTNTPGASGDEGDGNDENDDNN